MRAVLASPTMDMGGAERIVVELARGLAGSADALAVAAPPGPLDRELPAGVERLRLRDDGRSPTGALANTARLARFLRRFRPDVVHAHNPKTAAVAAAAARLCGQRPRPRLVATCHGVHARDQRAAALLLRGVDAVVCVSEDVRAALAAAGLPRERTRVIPNAVEPVGELPPARRAALDAELALTDRPVVAIVGRLVPQKAHDRFLEAAARVLEAVPDVRILVIGDGPLRTELEARAAALGLTAAVTFTGVRLDARELIARADLLVFSSEWEGLSLAALEALAAGTPVVSTAVAGMRELLGSGAGATVPPGRPGALADCIVELLRAPHRRAAMGAVGRELAARRYSPAAMVAAYLTTYRGG